MAQILFTTANLDLALTKIRDGGHAHYTGQHRELFEFQRRLLDSGGNRVDPRVPDRRRVVRRHLFMNAEIEISGRGLVPCMIKDVSSEGAGLILGEPLPLPSEIDLHVGKKIAVPVAVKWCRALTLGVEFQRSSRFCDLSLQF